MGKKSVSKTTLRETSSEYIAYPKALSLLKARLGATADELAGWIWLGPEMGGLCAYLNANELDLGRPKTLNSSKISSPQFKPTQSSLIITHHKERIVSAMHLALIPA